MPGEICSESKRRGTRVLSLHRYLVAIARESLNIGDGSIVDTLIWDQGSRTKVRRVHDRVVVDLAQLPGPLGFLDHDWVPLDSGLLTDTDVSV